MHALQDCCIFLRREESVYTEAIRQGTAKHLMVHESLRREKRAMWQKAKGRRQAGDPEQADWPHTAHHELKVQAGVVFCARPNCKHCYLECHPEKGSDAQSEFNGKECWNGLLMFVLGLGVGRW